jgi:hypothetical protein
MATFDCRVDVNGGEWPFALLRREAVENFATRASLLISCQPTAFWRQGNFCRV